MSDVLAWLAAGAIDLVGDLPGDARPGEAGHDPVFTVPSEALRRDLATRLAGIGKAAVVMAPLRVRSFLMRTWLDGRTADAPIDDSLDLAAVLEEAANSLVADVESTLRLAEEEARMEATEQGEPTEPEPATESATEPEQEKAREPEPERDAATTDAEPLLSSDEQLLFGDGAEEPVCFGFDDLARALGESPVDDGPASERHAVAAPVEEAGPATSEAVSEAEELAAESVAEPIAEPEEAAVEDTAARPPSIAACDLEANSFIADIVREVESRRQLGTATPTAPVPLEAEESPTTAEVDAEAAELVEASVATDEADEIAAEVEPLLAAGPVPESEPTRASEPLIEATPEEGVEIEPELEPAPVAVAEIAPPRVEAAADLEPEPALIAAAANEADAAEVGEVPTATDETDEIAAEVEPLFAPEPVPESEPTRASEPLTESAPEEGGEIEPELEPASVAVAEIAPPRVEAAADLEPEPALVAATANANEGSAALIAKSMDRIESFLGQLQGALVELAQRPAAASVDVAPLVQAVRDGFEQSTQLAKTTSTSLSSLGAHVDQLGARVEQGVGRVVQSMLEQPASAIQQHPATEFVIARTSRTPIVLLAFAALVIAWSILFWIKTGSPRLALGTLIGGNLIGCCLLGYGRAR